MAVALDDSAVIPLDHVFFATRQARSSRAAQFRFIA